MKNLATKIITILLLSCISVLNASEHIGAPSFGLKKLDFSNRARCAADSDKPSDTAFLMLNNVDPAKAVYRLALLRGEDTEAVTKLGISVFRTSVLRMVNLIHNRLINRELPLLPSDLDKNNRHIPSKYKQVMQNCKSGEHCLDLDGYIEEIWNVASSRLNSQTKFLKLYEVDNYHSQDNYLWPKDLSRRHREHTQLNCSYLKKFSPLQANLYGTKPTGAALRAIGEAAINQDDYLASCDDIEAQDDLQVAVYQLDLPEYKDRKWEKHGFDYWNSLRLYLSWTYRHAPEMDQIAFPFAHVFRNVNIEDALMLVPNGCKTLTPQACDNDRLAINAIRDLSKTDFRRNALNLDILRSVPNGPQQDLIDSPIPAVNEDILNFGDHDSASDWLNNLRENMSAAKNHHRSKLLKAFSNLNIVTNRFDSTRFLSDLSHQFNNVLDFNTARLNKDVQLSNDQLSDLYYLCSEFSFSQHETWGLIKEKLDMLKNLGTFDQITSNLNGETVAGYHQFIGSLADKINKTCYAVNQRSLWPSDFSIKKEGYLPWYIDKAYENKYESNSDERFKKYLETESPYLKINTTLNTDHFNNVICAHPAHCARLMIQSVVDIYAGSQYASTLWSLERQIKTPDLLNPYAERTSCQVYDPWYKTKSAIFNLLWDMGQAAVSLTTPGFIYTTANLNPRTVTSFRQLVIDGKIQYDTTVSEQSIVAGLTADFGPLVGAPCSVSVNRNTLNHNYLLFTGISVGACKTDEDHNLFAGSASNISDNVSRTRSSCVACTINFESLSGTLAFLSQNAGPVYFFVRGMYRLYKSIKDPLNIPRSWEVYPQDAAETVLSFGEVPNHCIGKLRRGQSCLKDSCQESLSAYIKKNHPRLPNFIESFNTNDSRNSFAYMKGCATPIRFRTNRSSMNDERSETCSVSRVSFPESCLEL